MSILRQEKSYKLSRSPLQLNARFHLFLAELPPRWLELAQPAQPICRRSYGFFLGSSGGLIGVPGQCASVDFGPLGWGFKSLFGGFLEMEIRPLVFGLEPARQRRSDHRHN